MRKFLKQLKDERGLTLVELLAVVVILAIVGTIAFVLVGNIIENSKKDAHIANAQQIIHAAKLYEASGGEISDKANLTKVKDLEEGGFIEPLISPWGDEPANYGKNDTEGVYMDGDEYKVILNGKDCPIDATEKELLSENRDEICDSGAGTP